MFRKKIKIRDAKHGVNRKEKRILFKPSKL
jgi:hypothetical protein